MNKTLLYHHHRGSDIMELFLETELSDDDRKKIKNAIGKISGVRQVIEGASSSLIIERRSSIIHFSDFLAGIRNRMKKDFHYKLEPKK